MNEREPASRAIRHGFSLVETMMAMAVFTTMLVLSLPLVELLLTLGDAGQDHVEALSTISRLAEEFRDDLRASDRLKAGPEGEKFGSVLRLEGPGDRLVRYRIEGREVERIEVVDGLPRRIERYRLPEGPKSASARFEVGAAIEGGARPVSLVIDRRLGLRRGLPRFQRITGYVGRIGGGR